MFLPRNCVYVNRRVVSKTHCSELRSRRRLLRQTITSTCLFQQHPPRIRISGPPYLEISGRFFDGPRGFFPFFCPVEAFRLRCRSFLLEGKRKEGAEEERRAVRGRNGMKE